MLYTNKNDINKNLIIKIYYFIVFLILIYEIIVSIYIFFLFFYLELK
jgi:hypothetical protein